MRYDPTRDDHNQYEIPEEASDDASESDNDADASKLREQANDEVEEVPVVSNEKFFEVATSLKDLFQTKVCLKHIHTIYFVYIFVLFVF